MSLFYCLSQKEFQLLRTLRHVEDWHVYAFLRERASFSTGRLEHESALKLTTSVIAAKISLPSSQGVAALQFDRWHVLRSLERLRDLGLVDEFSREGRFLRLRLPAVGEFQREREAERNTAPNDADSGGKSAPKNTRKKTVESHSLQGGGMPEALMSAPKSSRNAPENGGKPALKNPGLSSESLAAQGFQGSTPASVNNGVNNRKNNTLSTASGEFEFSPSAERQKPTPDSSPSAPSRQEPEKAGKKNVEETPVERKFREVLEEAGKGCFLHVDSAISRKLYCGWEASGFDHKDVGEAVRRVVAARWMPLNASSVDKMMRDIVKPADGSTQNTGRRVLHL